MSRSHTRLRKAQTRRRRNAFLDHLAAEKGRKGKSKRQSAKRRRDEIDRTVQVLNEKGNHSD